MDISGTRTGRMTIEGKGNIEEILRSYEWRDDVMVDLKKHKEEMDRGWCSWHPPRKKIKALRLNLTTGVMTEVELEYEILICIIQPLGVFQLCGGPTGYESFLIEDFVRYGYGDGGWVACAGTKGVWDRLEIDSEELERVMREEGISKISIKEIVISGEEKRNVITE